MRSSNDVRSSKNLLYIKSASSGVVLMSTALQFLLVGLALDGPQQFVRECIEGAHRPCTATRWTVGMEEAVEPLLHPLSGHLYQA